MLRISLGERPARSMMAVVVPGAMALLVACSGSPAAATATPSATAASTTAAASATATTATATTTSATAAATTAPAKASGTASATPSASATTAAAGTPPAAGTAAPSKAAPPAAPSLTSVTSPIANFAFAPVSGTAPLVVRWTNNDTVEHDVILADGSSPVIAPGATFERRFDRPGTYSYTCSFHPFMTGTVTVR